MYKITYMDFFFFRADLTSKLQIQLSNCLFDIPTCISQRHLLTNMNSWVFLYSPILKGNVPAHLCHLRKCTSQMLLEASLDFSPDPHLTQSRLCQFYFQSIAQAHPPVSILPATTLIQAIIIAWLTADTVCKWFYAFSWLSCHKE